MNLWSHSPIMGIGPIFTPLTTAYWDRFSASAPKAAPFYVLHFTAVHLQFNVTWQLSKLLPSQKQKIPLKNAACRSNLEKASVRESDTPEEHNLQSNTQAAGHRFTGDASQSIWPWWWSKSTSPSRQGKKMITLLVVNLSQCQAHPVCKTYGKGTARISVHRSVSPEIKY